MAGLLLFLLAALLSGQQRVERRILPIGAAILHVKIRMGVIGWSFHARLDAVSLRRENIAHRKIIMHGSHGGVLDQ